MQAGNLDLAKDLLEDTEVGEQAEELRKAMLRREAKLALAKSRSEGSSSHCMAPPLTAPRKRPMPRQETWSLSQGREFAPSAPGVCLTKDIVLHNRWVGHYKAKVPPNYTTKAFGLGTGLSDSSALAFVLNQLWLWHKAATGADCPWDLSNAIA
jgi:hypothetical protein